MAEHGAHPGGMTRGARHAVIVLFIINFALAGACLLFTVYQVSAANRQWCHTLALLTAGAPPRPAAAGPGREDYTLYLDFLALRRHFGC